MKCINEKISPINSISEEFGSTTTTGNSEEKTWIKSDYEHIFQI